MKRVIQSCFKIQKRFNSVGPKKQVSKLRMIEYGVTGIFLLSVGYGGYYLFNKVQKSDISLQEYFKKSYQDIVDKFTQPISDKLLDDIPEDVPVYQRKPTLVLNFEDLLIHKNYDGINGWRTQKRPGIDQFLEELSERYEIVIYSDGYMMNTLPFIDKIDRSGSISKSLFRDHTLYKNGKNLKDLSKMNRPLERMIMIEWNQDSIVQKENTIIIPQWKGDLKDKLLIDLLPFLKHLSSQPNQIDLRNVLSKYDSSNNALNLIDSFKKEKSQNEPVSIWSYFSSNKK